MPYRNSPDGSIQSIQEQISNVKFTAGVAHSVAEEAMEKVQMLEHDIKETISALEAKVLDTTTIQKMIDASVAQFRNNIPPKSFPPMSKTHPNTATENSVDEKFSRTAVIGGFARDTPKKDVVEFLTQSVLKNVQNIDETFAYNFGSVGFVRFQNRDAMFRFLTDIRTKDKPTVNGKPIWISTSKTPEERIKARHLGKFKKVLIESNLASPEDIFVDYKRGLIIINKVRVAEWKTVNGHDKLVADESKLKDVQIDIEPEKLYDAMAELLQE